MLSITGAACVIHRGKNYFESYVYTEVLKNRLQYKKKDIYFVKHSHKKPEYSLEKRAVLSLFSLELEISWVAVQSIHQNSKEWLLLWWIAKRKLRPWGCFSYFLLLWPWCQDFWGGSKDRYRSKSVSQMLLVCYNLLNSQNVPLINNSEKWLVTRTHLTELKKLQKFHRKKSNNWPMVSFIRDGSEITT